MIFGGWASESQLMRSYTFLISLMFFSLMLVTGVVSHKKLLERQAAALAHGVSCLVKFLPAHCSNKALIPECLAVLQLSNTRLMPMSLSLQNSNTAYSGVISVHLQHWSMNIFSSASGLQPRNHGPISIIMEQTKTPSPRPSCPCPLLLILLQELLTLQMVSQFSIVVIYLYKSSL